MDNLFFKKKKKTQKVNSTVQKQMRMLCQIRPDDVRGKPGDDVFFMLNRSVNYLQHLF